MADCINEWGRELNIEGIAEVLEGIKHDFPGDIYSLHVLEERCSGFL